jgi:hypothetical protein
VDMLGTFGCIGIPRRKFLADVAVFIEGSVHSTGETLFLPT